MNPAEEAAACRVRRKREVEEAKGRSRKRRSGGRIGRKQTREVGELEEGESEARRDSRCFVTARVNPASSGAPSHGTLRESSGPATLYTRAFVPMTSLKYGCPFLAGARAQEMGRGRRAAGSARGPCVERHGSAGRGPRRERERQSSRGKGSVFVSW